MTSSSTENTWEEIERLAISENKYEQEGALKRARRCVERRLQECGYATSEGGVVPQLRRYAADHGMDEREFSVIIEGLRYRNGTEHDDKEVGKVGVLSTVWALRAFCDPKPNSGQRKTGVPLGRLVVQLQQEFPTETSNFSVFFLRELTHHEQQGLERACKQGDVTVEEIRFLLSQPREAWKITVLALIGTDAQPKSTSELLKSRIQGLLTNPHGPESTAFAKAIASLARPPTPEEQRAHERKMEAATEELNRLEQKSREMKGMGCLGTVLVALLLFVVLTFALIMFGDAFLK